MRGGGGVPVLHGGAEDEGQAQGPLPSTQPPLVPTPLQTIPKKPTRVSPCGRPGVRQQCSIVRVEVHRCHSTPHQGKQHIPITNRPTSSRSTLVSPRCAHCSSMQRGPLYCMFSPRFPIN